MNKETWDNLIKDGAYSQELDWLAVDNKGQLGIFTALMNAPIPEKVKAAFEIYKELQERIQLETKSTEAIVVTHEKGDFSDWIAYAEKGFFAFDFQDIHRIDKKNQYDLIAKPINPLTIEEFHLPSWLIESLPILDCDFGSGDLPLTKVK